MTPFSPSPTASEADMTTALRSHCATAVYHMVEDEWLVRGTTDPMEALRLIVEVMHEYDTLGLLWGVSPNHLPHDGQPRQREIEETAEFLYGLLERARPGLYRKNPCGPGSYGEYAGWSWQIGFPKSKGPGVFEGVYFQQW